MDGTAGSVVMQPEPGMILTLDLDKTSLGLPVVGSIGAFESAVHHKSKASAGRNVKDIR